LTKKFFEEADINYSDNSQSKKDLANIHHNLANFKWTENNFEKDMEKTCIIRFNIDRSNIDSFNNPPQFDQPESISVLQPTEFHNNGQPKIPTPWVLFALRTIFRN